MKAIYEDKSDVSKLLSHVNVSTGELLDLGLQKVDEEGNNALHLAFLCEKVYSSTIDLLLERGINVELKNLEGKTAFEIAIEKGHWSYVLKQRFKKLGKSRGEQVYNKKNIYNNTVFFRFINPHKLEGFFEYFFLEFFFWMTKNG